METVVFGKRLVETLPGPAVAAPSTSDAILLQQTAGPAPNHTVLQSLMWEHAGIERSGDGLARAFSVAQSWLPREPQPTRASHEQRQMAVLARLMLEAASRRTESRGAHFRRDFPRPDDSHWLRHQVFRRAG